MPVRAGNLDDAEREIIASATEIHASCQDSHENQARRNRCALEIFHLAADVGELPGGNVVACQSADAAGDKKNENDDVECSAHAERIGEGSGGDTEADDVRQRIQFLAKRRLLIMTPRNFTDGDIEEQ